jgi:hypothetical protein
MVARGRCTSASVEVVIAIGMKPKLAIKRGYQHRSHASTSTPENASRIE